MIGGAWFAAKTSDLISSTSGALAMRANNKCQNQAFDGLWQQFDTTRQFSEAVGISLIQIRKIIRGRRGIGWKSAAKLSVFSGLPITAFLDDSSFPIPRGEDMLSVALRQAIEKDNCSLSRAAIKAGLTVNALRRVVVGGKIGVNAAKKLVKYVDSEVTVGEIANGTNYPTQIWRKEIAEISRSRKF